jgi:hypothetical protein
VGIAVFRFSIRELLWLTLSVAIASGWWVESARAKQWRQRAEITAGQLEAENLAKVVFQPNQVLIVSPHKDQPFQKVAYPTDSGR